MSSSRRTIYCLALVFAATSTTLIGLSWQAAGPDPTTRCKSPSAGGLRIVSLSPSVTEMLFLLGLGESIAGVTDHCDYPPEAKQLERVGGLGKPSLEKLLALSPDLIVGAGAERNDVLHALRKSGTRVLKVKIDSIDEMFGALRQIGDALGKRRQADDAVASMQSELRNIALQSGDLGRTRLPRVFIELWDDPLTTAGGGSFLDDVISRAGGVNVAHELIQPHVRISAEKVIEWNPDVLVIAHMKRGAISTSQVAGRIGWCDIAAVKQGRVFCDIPTDLLLRPGPRLIEGVKVLAQRLRADTPKNSHAMTKVDRGP